MSATGPTATRIPASPGFPVRWEQPGDEDRCWTMDRSHYPGLITPLDASFIACVPFRGRQHAAEYFDLPARPEARRFNGYLYSTAIPRRQVDGSGKHSAAALRAAALSLGRDWQERYLPEVQALIAETANIDFHRRSLPELADDLEQTTARVAREWEIHFQVSAPMMLAQSLFDELYQDLFGEDDQLGAFRLLQGLDNLTVRMGHELWELSRAARAEPEVLRILQASVPEEVSQHLRSSSAGRSFMAQLGGWLQRYGHRGNDLGIARAAWIDDPTPVIRMLKEYAARDDYDPLAAQVELAATRERAIAQARSELAGYPEPVTTEFELLLQAAQDATVLSEDHDYWIDFRGTHELRRVTRAIGEHLVACGRLVAEGDVCYLTLDELAMAARDPGAQDLQALVTDRRAELERYAALSPPPALGTMLATPPDSPVSLALRKFSGAPPQPFAAGLLAGVGGSAGTAIGPVKVVHSLDEASKVQPGDILVVATTTPPWTPLFNTAAAVVADSGGVLCHCAVVAREYRIPAVVGTGAGTQLLRDGQVVEVDGTAGTVKIVSP